MLLHLWRRERRGFFRWKVVFGLVLGFALWGGGRRRVWRKEKCGNEGNLGEMKRKDWRLVRKRSMDGNENGWRLKCKWRRWEEEFEMQLQVVITFEKRV